MTELLETMLGRSGPGQVLLWLADAALKGLLLLLAATAVCVLLRRASASQKHLCWSLALAAALAVPLLSLFLPPLSIELLPARAPEATAAWIHAGTELPAPAAKRGPEAVGVPRLGIPSAAMTAEGPAPTAAGGAEWPVWLVAVWAVGMAVVLLNMIFGMVAVRRIIRRAEVLRDPEWLALLDEVDHRLLVGRPVTVLRSADVEVPMTWGWMRPVVLLPLEASDWAAEKKRCVMAHELAHVRRGDCITQAMATTACAMHWFNPLAWRAARAMRLEREKACDDAVLRTARTKASTYATHLLDIARRAPASYAPPAAALMMARRTQLEGRIMAILDEGRRRSLHRPVAAGSVLVVGLFAVTLGAVRAAPATEADPDRLTAAVSKSILADSKSTAGGLKPAVQGTAESIRDVVKRSFEVSPDGWLHVDTDGGNIDVRTSNQNRVEVEVHRRARGGASEEDFRVEFDQDGDEIRVVGEHVRDRDWGRDGVSARFIITVPRRFNVGLETAGGNISIEDLDGTAEVETAGGNLSFGNVSGSVDAETSGGNVTIEASSGDVEVSTSGGNISLGRIGGTVDVQTSGGNISVDEVHGHIEAETSGGTIIARLVDQPEGDSALKTSGGSVTIYLADDIGVDLDAETSAGRVISDIEVTVQGELRNDRLRGTINGGGPALRLDTSAGDIHIRKL